MTYGVFAFAWAVLHIGTLDGFALISASGKVAQLFSYESTFTDTSGAAA